MNTLIRVSGGLWDISLALLYFSQLVGSGGRYMASVSSITLGRFIPAHATSESFQTIIGYVAIHVTLHCGRISEKRGKEARGGQR